MNQPTNARMTPAEYVAAAIRTEAPVDEAYTRVGIAGDSLLRMFHAAIGMCTETGEIQDQLKKHIFYGKPLDMVNVAEELGDLMWYVALMCDATGLDLTNVMENNIAKLRKRYPDKFTEHDALNRDTVNELSHFTAQQVVAEAMMNDKRSKEIAAGCICQRVQDSVVAHPDCPVHVELYDDKHSAMQDEPEEV